MFAKSFIALAAVASFAVAAPIEKKGAPANWAYGYLEDYETYHIRYLALKCHEQKKTEFFQDCCRPLLSTETLADNRKSYCVPSQEDTASVSASIAGAGSATPTASADAASESEYCESEESASSAAPTNAKVAAAYSSSSPSATASPAAESKAGEQYLAPAPSSTTTTKAAWTPAPTTAAPAPTTQAPSNNGGETMTGGFATYFFQGGNAGACGQVHGDNEMIIAIDQARWGSSSFGGGSSTCGKWVTVTNTNNGKSVSAMIADVCPTCTNGNSLDLSQGAFRAIANDADGMVPISWHWN